MARGIKRRTVMAAGAGGLLAGTGVRAWAQAEPAAPAPAHSAALKLTINGSERALNLDTRTSLLDALREHVGLTGTKKGCAAYPNIVAAIREAGGDNA